MRVTQKLIITIDDEDESYSIVLYEGISRSSKLVKFF